MLVRSQSAQSSGKQVARWSIVQLRMCWGQDSDVWGKQHGQCLGAVRCSEALGSEWDGETTKADAAACWSLATAGPWRVYNRI
jgi:hypothetical protein